MRPEGRWRAPENGEQRTERAGAKRQTFHGHGTPLRGDGWAVMSGENGNRKDARVGANRFGRHRSLCGFAADRDRRPPFRAL